jgi:hypothetical protein
VDVDAKSPAYLTCLVCGLIPISSPGVLFPIPKAKKLGYHRRIVLTIIPDCWLSRYYRIAMNYEREGKGLAWLEVRR